MQRVFLANRKKLYFYPMKKECKRMRTLFLLQRSGNNIISLVIPQFVTMEFLALPNELKLENLKFVPIPKLYEIRREIETIKEPVSAVLAQYDQVLEFIANVTSEFDTVVIANPF